MARGGSVVAELNEIAKQREKDRRAMMRCDREREAAVLTAGLGGD